MTGVKWQDAASGHVNNQRETVLCVVIVHRSSGGLHTTRNEADLRNGYLAEKMHETFGGLSEYFLAIAALHSILNAS